MLLNVRYLEGQVNDEKGGWVIRYQSSTLMVKQCSAYLNRHEHSVHHAYGHNRFCSTFFITGLGCYWKCFLMRYLFGHSTF